MIFSDNTAGWVERLTDMLATMPRIEAAYAGAVPPEWRLDGRQIDAWHMLVIERGALYYGAPGQEQRRGRGTLMLVPPQVVHSGWATKPSRFMTCRWLAPQATEQRALVLALDAPGPLLAEWRRLVARYHAVASPLERRSLEHATAGLLLMVARQVALHASFGDPDVAFLRQRVRTQPEHQWTVTELASARGISARELQRRCRSATGHGPKRLILEERHRAAEALLVTGTTSVAEAAARYGFSEAAAFSRSFTTIRGYPPSARIGQVV